MDDATRVLVDEQATCPQCGTRGDHFTTFAETQVAMPRTLRRCRWCTTIFSIDGAQSGAPLNEAEEQDVRRLLGTEASPEQTKWTE